jgi:hypothetical protein
MALAKLARLQCKLAHAQPRPDKSTRTRLNGLRRIAMSSLADSASERHMFVSGERQDHVLSTFVKR